MQLQSLYNALANLPSSVPVAKYAGLMQRQVILQAQITELERQLQAENTGIQNAWETHETMSTETKVFYAWQDDLPKEICRDLIRAAAETACTALNAEEPDRNLVLDEGPLGAPGMCDIPNTILKKIAECDIFLCDLTFVGAYTNRSSTEKKVSNPNVFFEFGFAVARLGFRRVIGVMNSNYGAPRHHAFDVKRRWALRYNLRPGADAAAQSTARSQLSEKLVEALRTVFEKNPPRKRIRTSTVRFQQIRESFESAVAESSFHEVMSNTAILAVCLVPDRVHNLDRNSIHGKLPPLLHENWSCHWSTDRHTEISVAERGPTRSALDVDQRGVIRAASSMAISGGVKDTMASEFFGEYRAEHLIRATILERTLVYSLLQWAKVLQELHVVGPFRLGVSLLSVRNWDLLLYDRDLCNRSQKEAVLSADPITIPSLAGFGDLRTVFQNLTPALDDIAHSFGRREWPENSTFG